MSPQRTAVPLFVMGTTFLIATVCRSGQCMAAAQESIALRVTNQALGKTMAHLGPSNLTRGPTDQITEYYIRDSGFNTTKFWIRTDNYEQLARRTELYGPNTKEVVIRQVRERPEDIDWELELQKGADEPHFDLCKRFGIQPVLQMIAPLARYNTGSVEPLVQQVFWRRVFLYCYWANKIKRYNFILWSMGSENSLEAGVMQADVGSEAVREAEKLTGVKVLVSAPGDDWTIQDIVDGFERILKSDTADRLDGLSFQSFNVFSLFPQKSDYPTYREHLLAFDEVQRKSRPGKPLLPYWDTSWFWRAKPGAAGHQSDHYLTGLEYISRLIWGNLGGVVVSTPYMMYGADTGVAYGLGSEIAGVVKVDRETKRTRAGRSYYALRMLARATVGGKDRLRIDGLPAGDDVLALASRDGRRLYLTVVNRTEGKTYSLGLTFHRDFARNACVVREFSEDTSDEVVFEGTVPSKMELKPLCAKQIIVDLEARP